MNLEDLWQQIGGFIASLDTNRRSSSCPKSLLSHYEALTKSRNPRAEKDIVRRYLAFVVSTFGMSYFVRSRELPEVHSWIVRGLTDEYNGSQEETVETGRVVSFLVDPRIRNSPFFYNVLIEWLGCLYYYCFEQTAIQNIGEEFF
jgi:hypothetical protein